MGQHNQVVVSILSVGTELTTGQILNKNGQWISERCKELGLQTHLHLVVPDEKKLILEALQFSANHADVIFVTGGLGPTTDDFTRDVIATWSGKKMQWHEDSWKHIEDRLIPRGITVKDIQKQQCYFPEGSEILINSQGTANAFFFHHQDKDIFVLPGPPREIESLWKDQISQRLQEKAKHVDRLITKSWDTLGRGESDIAELAEAALKGCDLEKAYRVHLPFVEFKISYLQSQTKSAEKWITAIEQALCPLTVLRDGEDGAETLSKQLAQFHHIMICDELKGSSLLSRLFPFVKKLITDKKLSFVSTPKQMTSKADLILSLKEESPGIARASLFHHGQLRTNNFSSPYRSLLLKERESQYFAEMAMIFWFKELAQDPG